MQRMEDRLIYWNDENCFLPAKKRDTDKERRLE